MVQPDAVLEVAYRILDLGVAAMISFQFEQLPCDLIFSSVSPTTCRKLVVQLLWIDG